MPKCRIYTEAEKQQILDEVKLMDGNIVMVAKKNSVPISTIRTWLKQKKKRKINHLKDTNDDHKNIIKELKSKLSDSELENKILKDLLKKTYQVWQTD